VSHQPIGGSPPAGSYAAAAERSARGRINNFSLDALTVLAGRAGLGVRMQIEPDAA
jgi:hypothetical protein